MDSKILRDLTYGVYIISSLDKNQKMVGCVANSVMQITSDPKTIAISINHDNYTNQSIKDTKKFSISIIREKTDPKIIGNFGYHTSYNFDKFKDVDYEKIENMPVIKDSCGFIVCKVISQLENSTHTIFIGEIIQMKKYNDNKAMTYDYYHNVIKGKTPKNAPTYQENIEQQITENRWRCMICGYIYEGETLPENFICPICGASIEYFEKI